MMIPPTMTRPFIHREYNINSRLSLKWSSSCRLCCTRLLLTLIIRNEPKFNSNNLSVHVNNSRRSEYVMPTTDHSVNRKYLIIPTVNPSSSSNTVQYTCNLSTWQLSDIFMQSIDTSWYAKVNHTCGNQCTQFSHLTRLQSIWYQLICQVNNGTVLGNGIDMYGGPECPDRNMWAHEGLKTRKWVGNVG